MIANDLRTGDTFVCVDEINTADKRKAKPATVLALLGTCVTYERIHLRTSAGTWCIPKEAPVVKLTAEQKPARKNNRYAHAKRTKAVTA